MVKTIPASKLMDYEKLLTEIKQTKTSFIIEENGKKVAEILPYQGKEKITPKESWEKLRQWGEKFAKEKGLKDAPLLLNVINATTIMPTAGRLKGICRDPKDDQILETALNGKANYLVTGDDDLLALGKYKEIEIITPAKFLKVFKIKRK